MLSIPKGCVIHACVSNEAYNSFRKLGKKLQAGRNLEIRPKHLNIDASSSDGQTLFPDAIATNKFLDEFLNTSGFSLNRTKCRKRKILVALC